MVRSPSRRNRVCCSTGGHGHRAGASLAVPCAARLSAEHQTPSPLAGEGWDGGLRSTLASPPNLTFPRKGGRTSGGGGDCDLVPAPRRAVLLEPGDALVHHVRAQRVDAGW